VIINIRGTSGSGKTTVVRGIMAKGIAAPMGENSKKPDGYLVKLPFAPKPLFVVGSYENTCGGCDAISTQDEICDRVRAYASLGHVMMEGLLMSHSFARYAALDRELHAQGHHCIWGFLDTPLEVCLDRVRARREAARLAKVNPPPPKELNTKNTVDKHRDNQEVYLKFLNAKKEDWKLVSKFGFNGLPVRLDARIIDHTNAIEQVYSWLSDGRSL
jgi:hypothetical protein